MSRLVKSFIGSFTARAGLSLVEFLGIIYIAMVARAGILGAYALFRAVFVIASMVIDSGTREASIKRIAESRSRGEFLVASLLLRAALLVPVVVAILLFRDPIVDYVGSQLAVPFLLALAILKVFGETVYAGLHGEQRVGRAELTLFAKVVGKVATWGVLLSLGFGLTGVLVGLVVGGVLQVGVGLRFLSIRPRPPARSHFTSLLRFSRYSWLGTVRERAWVWTDTLVLGFFVTAEVVGIYELSWQLSAAFFLVSSALSSTLFANVDRLLREEGRETVRRAVEESLVYAGIIAIPGLAGAVVVGTSVLSAFGPVYAAGYPALVILILARLLHGYEVVFAKVINGLDRPDLTFRVDATFVALNVAGNVVAIAAVGWIGAAVATALSMGVRTVLSYRYLRSLVDVAIPTREILLEGLAAILMGGVVLYATRGARSNEFETALAICGGGILYVAGVVVFVDRVRTRVSGLVTTLL